MFLIDQQKRGKIGIVILLFGTGIILPSLCLAQEVPVATIHSIKPNGHWHDSSTWLEHRIPTTDDVVYVDVPIKMRHQPTIVRGLHITPSGRIDGLGKYNNGYLAVSDYFYNQGSIGRNMFELKLGGWIRALGSIALNKIRLSGGEIELPPVVNHNLSLTRDISLVNQSLKLGGRFETNNRIITLTATSTDLELENPVDKLIVYGTSTINIGREESEARMIVDSIQAASSTVHFQAPNMGINGDVRAEKIYIHHSLKLEESNIRFTGDVYIKPGGYINGEAWRVVHWFEIVGDLINYGSVGPYVYLHLWGSLHNHGSYSNSQGLVLRGDGERNFIGSIPNKVYLRGNQIWRSSPTLYVLDTGGYEITLPQGVGLALSSSNGDLKVAGSGVITYVDPVTPDYQAYARAIYAPDARVIFGAKGSISDDISANVIEIRDRLEVADSLTMNANQVAFIGGTLQSDSEKYKRLVEINTPSLRGAGHLGSYLEAYFNTDIPRGFSAGWNTGIYLRHRADQTGDQFKLASSSESILAGIQDIFLDREPNLREVLNSGKAHYYSYHSNNSWSDIWSINAEYNPFNLQEELARRSYFDFSFVPHQQSGEPFWVQITARDATYAGELHLSAKRGRVSPRRITLSDGSWQGELRIIGEGSGEQLVATGLGKYAGYSGRSNYFGVSQAQALEGVIRGVVRSASGARIDYGLVEFTDLTTGEHWSTSIDSNGRYSIALPCGAYEVKASGASLRSLSLSCGETIIYDIEISRSCVADRRIPVIFVPGIQGSDSSDNPTVIFPELLSYAPRWDSAKLHLHDPFGAVGWKRLQEALEEEGYRYGCTIFAAPYDWALSAQDSAEQYLMPMIEHAKKVASSTQVDIVAHSMGGLVARVYIQGEEYQGDVRRFAMVGTPNAGSAMAYFSWEGGDTEQADSYGGNFFEHLLSKIQQTNQFQTKTTVKNHLIKTGEEKPLCWGFGPPSEYTACDRERIKAFLQSYAPSVGELYPSYDFLFDEQSKKMITPAFENTLLRALNNQECEEGDCGYNFIPIAKQGVEIRNFVGLEENILGPRRHTLENIYVSPSKNIRYDYSDGKIEMLESGIGDGTVLVDSVQAVKARSEFLDEKHSALIKNMKDQIKNFLTE
ncbi:MAG: lipase/acyltransferase domain-containing protein [Patescibacteria group bacterium]